MFGCEHPHAVPPRFSADAADPQLLVLLNKYHAEDLEDSESRAERRSRRTVTPGEARERKIRARTSIDASTSTAGASDSRSGTPGGARDRKVRTSVSAGTSTSASVSASVSGSVRQRSAAERERQGCASAAERGGVKDSKRTAPHSHRSTASTRSYEPSASADAAARSKATEHIHDHSGQRGSKAVGVDTWNSRGARSTAARVQALAGRRKAPAGGLRRAREETCATPPGSNAAQVSSTARPLDRHVPWDGALLPLDDLSGGGVEAGPARTGSDHPSNQSLQDGVDRSPRGVLTAAAEAEPQPKVQTSADGRPPLHSGTYPMTAAAAVALRHKAALGTGIAFGSAAAGRSSDGGEASTDPQHSGLQGASADGHLRQVGRDGTGFGRASVFSLDMRSVRTTEQGAAGSQDGVTRDCSLAGARSAPRSEASSREALRDGSVRARAARTAGQHYSTQTQHELQGESHSERPSRQANSSPHSRQEEASEQGTRPATDAPVSRAQVESARMSALLLPAADAADSSYAQALAAHRAASADHELATAQRSARHTHAGELRGARESWSIASLLVRRELTRSAAGGDGRVLGAATQLVAMGGRDHPHDVTSSRGLLRL